VRLWRRRRPPDHLELRLVGRPALLTEAVEVLTAAVEAAGWRVERTTGPYPVAQDPALVRRYLHARMGRSAPVAEHGPAGPAAQAVAALWRALAAAEEARGVGVGELARAAQRGRSWVYGQLAAGPLAGEVVRVGRGRYALGEQPPDGHAG
jgi:hypothetical protein